MPECRITRDKTYIEVFFTLINMNYLNLLTKLYYHLLKKTGVPYRVLAILQGWVRSMANRILPVYLDKAYSHKIKQSVDVIVSFTSFPTRINNVWQVVECMLRQTYQPTKIILWLSKNQFPSEDSIPLSLQKRVGNIFEIRFVEGDIRSHKKYYYVAKEYPNSLVFLIDDDIYYPTDILERSYKERQLHPKTVICNYGYTISYDANGIPKPYNQWIKCHKTLESESLFYGSGGGTLFKPSELYNDLTKIELARNLCPIADDIWLNAMTKLANNKIIILKYGIILPIHNDNDVYLCSMNLGKSKNDEQIKNVETYYKELGLKVFEKSTK